MNIYPSNSVILEIIQNHKCHYHKIIKREFPLFYQSLISDSDKRFAELLYLYLDPGIYTCKQCGSSDVSFMEITTGYKNYCSTKCLNNSPEHKVGIKTFLSDPKNIEARYTKSQKTYKLRTGYSHPMHNPAVKDPIITNNTKRMRQKYFVEFRTGLTQKQYTRKCRHLTNTVYKAYKNTIDPVCLRSMDIVIDHIYSIFEGWKNNVPFEIICHPTNMQMIPKKENSSKISRCDKTLATLYEDCKCFSIKHLLTGKLTSDLAAYNMQQFQREE